MVQRIVILKSLSSILNKKLQRCLNRETRHKKFKLLTNLKQLEIKTHHQKSQLTAIGAHSGTGRNARLIAEEVIRLGPVPAPILLHCMMGRSARARLWRSDLVKLETVQVMTDKAVLILFFDIFARTFWRSRAALLRFRLFHYRRVKKSKIFETGFNKNQYHYHIFILANFY